MPRSCRRSARCLCLPGDAGRAPQLGQQGCVPPWLLIFPLCPRELAECRKTQQEENADESRSRVQLATIEAKHVSRGRGGEGDTRAVHRGWEMSRGFLVPSSPRRKPGGCGCAGKNQETLGAEHSFSAFVSWLELAVAGLSCPSSTAVLALSPSRPSLAAVTPVCAPPAAVPVGLRGLCNPSATRPRVGLGAGPVQGTNPGIKIAPQRKVIFKLDHSSCHALQPGAGRGL